MIAKTFDVKVDDFIKSLNRSTGTKITRHIDLLVRFGNQLRMPYSKSLGENLFELGIRGQQEIRIFYTFNNGIAILLHGFIKKTQKTPPKELKTALTKLRVLTDT
jgi:phage-related protein